MKLAFVLVIVLSAAAAFGQATIRSVDFKNFTYRPYCVGENSRSIRVENGEYSRETPQDGYVDHFYFSVLEIAYGDLDGDAKDEAAIITVCNTGGTGNFTEGFIYRMSGGKPLLAARFPGGDRAYGGLRSIKIEKGLLVVEQYEAGENGGACCPEFILTKKYKLVGRRLVPTGTVAKREVVPKRRVSFDRGANSKTISLRIPAGEVIGLVLAARRGQRLSVTTDTSKANVQITNQADVKTRPDGFDAILAEDGDQIVEVENITAADSVITVTIRIN
jgi:hypothetical protein